MEEGGGRELWKKGEGESWGRRGKERVLEEERGSELWRKREGELWKKREG